MADHEERLFDRTAAAAVAAPPASRDRRKSRAELMGGHTHSTLCGVQVHVWLRGRTYLARGQHLGRPFGETLGIDIAGATARLRQLLTEIENGTYTRPSDRPRQHLTRGVVPRLTLRELIAEFLARSARPAAARRPPTTLRGCRRFSTSPSRLPACGAGLRPATSMPTSPGRSGPSCSGTPPAAMASPAGPRSPSRPDRYSISWSASGPPYTG